MASLQEDQNLTFEADKTGMIHVRKKSSPTEFLPGYGVTDFGVSPFEEKKLITSNKVLIGAGVVAAGALLTKFRDQISSLYTYALLLRESKK